MSAIDSMLAIGLMSGTSADGVDAALVRTDGDADYQFIYALTLPYEQGLRSRVLNVAQHAAVPEEIRAVEVLLTKAHLQACRELLDQTGVAPSQIQIVGLHGHTIRHIPERAWTWQIGDPSLVSEFLGCPVVSDFRRRDMAAGGQGAPLAALFHRQLLQDEPRPSVVLNLGGVANITWIGEDDRLLAGDTGPGCGLLDQWVQKKTGQLMDRNGTLANSGHVDDAAVGSAMQHAFFQRDLPKSADRFAFGFVDVEHLGVADGAATLCAITVAGVAETIRRLDSRLSRVWVTGGGARNPVLLSMLRDQLGDVRPIEDAGLRSDSMEAECFAWLAVRRFRGLPTSLPTTTGCRRPTCGGVLTA